MDSCRYSMTRMVLAPCSPFTVTKDLFVKAAQLARKHEGVRLHTHMAENQVHSAAFPAPRNSSPGDRRRPFLSASLLLCMVM